jgi:hypothetical protein
MGTNESLPGLGTSNGTGYTIRFLNDKATATLVGTEGDLAQDTGIVFRALALGRRERDEFLDISERAFHTDVRSRRFDTLPDQLFGRKDHFETGGNFAITICNDVIAAVHAETYGIGIYGEEADCGCLLAVDKKLGWKTGTSRCYKP